MPKPLKYKNCYKYRHLYPEIKRLVDRDWSFRDIAEDLGLKEYYVRDFVKRKMERKPVKFDDKTILRVWFERLRKRAPWRRNIEKD